MHFAYPLIIGTEMLFQLHYTSEVLLTAMLQLFGDTGSLDNVLQKQNVIPNMADMRLTQEKMAATRFGTLWQFLDNLLSFVCELFCRKILPSVGFTKVTHSSGY
jgi:hypothetical protein